MPDSDRGREISHQPLKEENYSRHIRTYIHILVSISSSFMRRSTRSTVTAADCQSHSTNLPHALTDITTPSNTPAPSSSATSSARRRSNGSSSGGSRILTREDDRNLQSAAYEAIQEDDPYQLQRILRPEIENKYRREEWLSQSERHQRRAESARKSWIGECVSPIN